MNGQRRDPVDSFLEDMGRAPIPVGLPLVVRSRIEADGMRPRRPRPLAAVAAVACVGLLVAGVLIIASGRAPFVMPPRQTAVSSATAGATPTVSASPSNGSTPTAAPITGSWQLTVPLIDVRSVRLEVADQSGRLVDARVAASYPEGTGTTGDDPFALDIRPVPDQPRELFVGWSVVVCEYRGRLLLDDAGTGLTLVFAPSPGCDLAPIAQGVILEFSNDVDASDFAGRLGRRESDQALVDFGELVPLAVGFADAQTGWVGGSTEQTDALVWHTTDNGSSWRASGLGQGRVAEIAVVDRTHAFATLECKEHEFGCRTGTFRWDDDYGGWSRMTNERFIHMEFAAMDGIALVLPDDESAPVVAELRLTDDGGDTWAPIGDPCPRTMNLADADQISSTSLVVLCLAEGGTDATRKVLLASNDRGATWIERASTDAGGLVMSGTPTRFDIEPDGSGWMWGTRMPLLETSDFGTSWSALDVADGDVRIVREATYLGAGTGFALVDDPDRSEWLLLQAHADLPWNEIASWRFRSLAGG